MMDDVTRRSVSSDQLHCIVKMTNLFESAEPLPLPSRPRRGPLDLENRPAGLGRLGTASPATQKIPRRVLHAPTLGTSYSTALNGHYDTVMSCSLANSMRMPGYIQSKASSLSNSRSVTMPRHFFVDP
jgi:hypothetical protein